MLNFYEDTTQAYSDEASIRYSTLDTTDNAVTATLILPEGFKAVTKTHKFLENGYYDFEYTNAEGEHKIIRATVSNIEKLQSDNGIYLSDLGFDTELSYAWDGIKKDKNAASSTIGLYVNGEVVNLRKGLGAHAPSEVVYDIEAYVKDYPRLSAYLGVDKSRVGTPGSVRFTILASKDGEHWEELKKMDVLKGDSESVYVDIDLTGHAYLKLYADTVGSASNDHSVYGDIRLIRKDYNIQSQTSTVIERVSSYDEQIKSKYTVGSEINEEVRTLILKRELVNRYGYSNLQQMAQVSSGYKEAIEYMFTNEYALAEFIEAGTLDGEALRTLEAWCRLYSKHKDDLNNFTNGRIYRRMMIATSVAYCKVVKAWVGYNPESDPVTKYEIFKELYDAGKFKDYDMFNSLSMELVRYVMDAKMDDEEIKWLRYYSEDKITDEARRLNPYSFIKYVQPNYTKPEYYSEENREKWEDKYSLSKYGITSYGENGRYKIWMVMEQGGMCWAISETGVNLHEVHGNPSVNIF